MQGRKVQCQVRGGFVGDGTALVGLAVDADGKGGDGEVVLLDAEGGGIGGLVNGGFEGGCLAAGDADMQFAVAAHVHGIGLVVGIVVAEGVRQSALVGLGDVFLFCLGNPFLELAVAVLHGDALLPLGGGLKFFLLHPFHQLAVDGAQGVETEGLL